MNNKLCIFIIIRNQIILNHPFGRIGRNMLGCLLRMCLDKFCRHVSVRNGRCEGDFFYQLVHVVALEEEIDSKERGEGRHGARLLPAKLFHLQKFAKHLPHASVVVHGEPARPQDAFFKRVKLYHRSKHSSRWWLDNIK